MIPRELALTAAALLQKHADALRGANEYDGKWFLDRPAAKADKREHDKLVATAAELRRAAG